FPHILCSKNKKTTSYKQKGRRKLDLAPPSPFSVPF
ncbi:MAG: hypothetical protein ACJAUZ_001229, partial [Flavobacteriaceae bacterium]